MEHVRPLYPITVELAKQIEEESKRHNGEFDDLATKCMAIAKAQEWVDRTVLINKDELAAIESGIDKHLYELSQLGHHVNVCENLKLKLQQAHNSNSRVADSYRIRFDRCTRSQKRGSRHNQCHLPRERGPRFAPSQSEPDRLFL
eukprot:GEZU01004277.1.p1 GENE.GEZU01004277.1~~GEZU01004277.1.p1  ORF type:complete len:145 (+),score=19.08 GEZU01004277.1:207-641(+)